MIPAHVIREYLGAIRQMKRHGIEHPMVDYYDLFRALAAIERRTRKSQPVTPADIATYIGQPDYYVIPACRLQVDKLRELKMALFELLGAGGSDQFDHIVGTAMDLVVALEYEITR